LLTILIAAHNAAATIRRAVASCLREPARVLLIDDRSTDDTVRLAKSVGLGASDIIPCDKPGGVARARQTGLDAVDTEFAAWLDADDEWIPGRGARLITRLREGADVVADGIWLHEGLSGRRLRMLEVPGFLAHDPRPLRLFERNYLPGDTQVGFRAQSFRDAGGYDTSVFGPESFDVLLRTLKDGASFAYLSEAGYRMYAYPGSVSRNIARQRAELKKVLQKHAYDEVRKLCAIAKYHQAITGWILVAMAMYRDDWNAALRFVDEIEADCVDQRLVLEPTGPCPLPEAWRCAFYRGTALLYIAGREREALDSLDAAERIAPTAEGANNLGVAYRHLFDHARAHACFVAALRRYSNYRDARLNMAQPNRNHVTTHPLRKLPSRSEYPTS
jgi:glycosyltransferase involved in cell wall biosynthesis